MNAYEIILFIWLILLTIGFSFTLIDMLDRTKKLKDTITKLRSYIDVDKEDRNMRMNCRKYAIYDSECNLICVSDHMEFDLCEKNIKGI